MTEPGGTTLPGGDREPRQDTGSDSPRPPDRSALQRLRDRLRTAKEIYEGVFMVPYRSTIHREFARQYDLFLLVTFSDLLGVPNPVEFYTLELLPELMEQFHRWHLRMGMERAPEGGFRCC